MEENRLSELAAAGRDVSACDDPYIVALLRRYRNRAALSDSLRYLQSFDERPLARPIAARGDGPIATDPNFWPPSLPVRLNGPRLDAAD